jgi:succinate dehydrogenase / fumarate reductase iron-sulfur subunit/fumarate reductase (CoM/CoB) subunit B
MRLRVRRFDPGSDVAPREEIYEVAEFEGMTVLDALNWVRQHVDPSIACRFSCRVANACKECPALANGEATYLCTYPAIGEVRVEPLPHKRLVRDIVVELE